MKPTRLQLLILLAVLGAGGYGLYVWWQNHAAAEVTAPVDNTPQAPASGSLLPPNPAPPAHIAPAPKIAQTTATPPMTSSADGSYTVVKGDTLWRIAAVNSPVHQGPGWVAIWKANKTTVKNFDRLEVGWNLTIPTEIQDYRMPYWTPRALAQSPRPSTNYVVDLRQIPTGADSVLVDLKQLPSGADSVLVDLKQLPAGDDFALASLPENLRVDLKELPAAPEMALAMAAPDEFKASAFPRPVEGNLGQPQFYH